MRLSHAETAAERARARTVPSTPESSQLESNQLDESDKTDSARGAPAGTDGAGTLEGGVGVPPNGWAPIDLAPILFPRAPEETGADHALPC